MHWWLDDRAKRTKKIVLLTGCTGRLGTFFVKQCGDIYAIIGVARKASNSHLPLIDFIPADISTDAGKIVARALERHGQIDVLINSAAWSRWLPLKDKPPDEFLYELRVNLVAPLALASQLVQQCWALGGIEKNKKRNRNIVNISSIASVQVYEHLGQGAYAATKAALNTLTKHMASEYRDYGIRVNAVAPNSFPHYVSLQRVCAVIVDYIEGTQSGEIKIVDQNHEYIA